MGELFHSSFSRNCTKDRWKRMKYVISKTLHRFITVGQLSCVCHWLWSKECLWKIRLNFNTHVHGGVMNTFFHHASKDPRVGWMQTQCKNWIHYLKHFGLQNCSKIPQAFVQDLMEFKLWYAELYIRKVWEHFWNTDWIAQISTVTTFIKL